MVENMDSCLSQRSWSPILKIHSSHSQLLIPGSDQVLWSGLKMMKKKANRLRHFRVPDLRVSACSPKTRRPRKLHIANRPQATL
jgi:hypothetical protein